MSTSVFVSGATGFIAQHIIALLISKGYNVVGSVRSASKGDHLKELYGSQFKYEIVPVLESEGAFDEALKKHPEVTVFLHTASPVTFTAEDNEKEVLIPAINGTRFVLDSINRISPQIERVVYTSSIVAIATPEQLRDPAYEGGEDVFSPITYEEGKSNGLSAYFASKTFAEKAAWEFVETNKPKFTLSTVNPVFVVGPQAKDEEAKGGVNLTAQIITSLYNLKKDDKVPETAGHFVDARDVARAHVLAFEKDEAKGQRIITVSGKFNSQLILNIIRKNFPELQERLPIGNPEDIDLSNIPNLKNTKSRELLGIDYIDFETSVNDAIEQVIKANA
ncbi:protein induced by osmotic stress [Scheffersomyces xylosifermentans]|uniref:protein induced by osmotic stress n=1 Tax=Scheffersomyces xylosifermentans TaxID=1304137 RepID=UPI00315D8686